MLSSTILFIAFLWIAHGFWCDYKNSKRPPTKEEQELMLKRIKELELELFHKRLHLQDLASPWEPRAFQRTKRSTSHNPSSYTLGQGNLIDLKLHKTQSLMFISAEAKLAYLQSKEWFIVKNQRLLIANYKCEYCGSTNQLQCHHVTYERLTMEHIEDIVILCGGLHGCHQRIHNLLGYNRTTEYPISVLKD